jgi:hypothetical protein
MLTASINGLNETKATSLSGHGEAHVSVSFCARAALPPRGRWSSGKKFSVESGNKRQRGQFESTRESPSSFVRGDDVVAKAIAAERCL